MEINVASLMDKPVWQMTSREFCALAQYANGGQVQATPAGGRKLCTGVRALAEYLGCCEATIYILKRDGVLDDAIVSKIGKKTVFDAEKARSLADARQQLKRNGYEED